MYLHQKMQSPEEKNRCTGGKRVNQPLQLLNYHTQQIFPSSGFKYKYQFWRLPIKSLKLQKQTLLHLGLNYDIWSCLSSYGIKMILYLEKTCLLITRQTRGIVEAHRTHVPSRQHSNSILSSSLHYTKISTRHPCIDVYES